MTESNTNKEAIEIYKKYNKQDIFEEVFKEHTGKTWNKSMKNKNTEKYWVIKGILYDMKRILYRIKKICTNKEVITLIIIMTSLVGIMRILAGPEESIYYWLFTAILFSPLEFFILYVTIRNIKNRLKLYKEKFGKKS